MVRASGDSVGSGSSKVLPSKCHLYVEECEAKQSKEGNWYFACKFQVKGSTVDGQVGKEMQYQNIAAGKMFSFAAACGLTDAVTGQPYTRERLDKMRADKKAGRAVEDCDFDPDEAIGRHFCGAVVQPKDKEWPEVGFDIWSVFDPEAADIPKDAELMAQLGVEVDAKGLIVSQGHAGNGSGGGTATATKPAAATTAKPASRFADSDD